MAIRSLKDQPSHSSTGSPSPTSAGLGPLGPVMALGRKEMGRGWAIGVVGACILHSSVAAQAATSLAEVRDFAGLVREHAEQRLRMVYAIQVDPPPPPEPEPGPEPEPVPEPTPMKPQPKPSDTPPPEEPPPTAAEAGKLLTAAPDPNAPLDLTADGFVTGEGTRFAGGVTAVAGTSRTAVRNPAASVGDGAGLRRTMAPPAPQPPVQDLSKSPKPLGTTWNDCGFPPEADVEQINHMRVRLVVTVDTDGSAKSAQVLGDPGYGFGRRAQQCALRKRYSVGLDLRGQAVVKTTPPFFITFER